MTSLQPSNKENQVANKESAPKYQTILSELKRRGSHDLSVIAFSTNPTIARLVNKYSFTWTAETISNLISEFVGQMNTNKQMDAPQIIKCAEMLMGDYHLYRLDDFYKCLQNMVKGIYGVDTFKMDAQVIYKCFERYDVDRTDAINRVQESKAESFKNIDLSSIDVKVTDAIKDILPDQQWLKEFDAMPQTTFGGKRFVEIDGLMLDQTEFLEYKMKSK